MSSNQNESGPETRMVVVDGREALAYVILRPGPTGGTVLLEAAAKDGVDERQVAQTLRHIANQWSPRPGLEGVLDEIAVRRARQRTAHGGGEHCLPDGTGQHPENIDADVTRMACDQATEGGYLDWLHIVRAAAAQAYAESRPTQLRADLVDLAARVTGWIQAIDHRAEDPPAGTPVRRADDPATPGEADARICRHPLRIPPHAPEWLSCDIHRAAFAHREDCPGHGTPDCITACAGGEPDDDQLLGLAVELLATAPRAGDLLTPGGVFTPTLACALAPLLNQPDGGSRLPEVLRQDLVAVARVLLGRDAS